LGHLEMEMVNFPHQVVLACCRMEILQFVTVATVVFPSLIPRVILFVIFVLAYSFTLILFSLTPMTTSWLPMPTPPQTRSEYSRQMGLLSRIFPLLVIRMRWAFAWIPTEGLSPLITPMVAFLLFEPLVCGCVWLCLSFFLSFFLSCDRKEI